MLQPRKQGTSLTGLVETSGTLPVQGSLLGRLAKIIYIYRTLAGIHKRPWMFPKHIRPLIANLRLTHNCQAGCVTCDFWKKTWEDKISTSQAIDLINRLPDVGVRILYISGGEPLLRRDLFEILHQADTHRFVCILIATNGLLLKQLYKEVNDSPITHVGVSLDAIGEKNDEIRGYQGYFDLALEGAELLKGKEVLIISNLTGPSADSLDKLFDIAERRNWGFTFNLLENRKFFLKGGDVVNLWPDPAEAERVVQILGSRRKYPPFVLDYVRRYLLAGAPGNVLNEPPCIRGFNQVGITAEGNVWSGCSVLSPMGNVLESDIGKIIGSNEYRDRCLAMVRRECPGCSNGALESLWYANNSKNLLGVTRRLLSSVARTVVSA